MSDVDEYRARLVAILAKLDQLAADVAEIHAAAIYADLNMMAEDVAESLAAMRANVEAKLEQLR